MMSKLLLKDLLHFTKNEIELAKIKFNIREGNDDPLDLYLTDPEIVNKQWLFWNKERKYFYEGQIAICLVRYKDDKWLLTTIKQVTKDLNVSGGISFEGEEIEKYRPLFGRVIVEYHKTSQQMGRYFSSLQDDLIVHEILPTKYDGEKFPGYDNVRLTYHQLAAIIRNNKKDWVAALSNQKAVYLITDKSNGKLYVGSATSDNGMLLQRWTDYVYSGHGGNKDLVKLVKENGIEHVKNYFQYSILENYNAKIDDKLIIEREQWWKETLQSRTPHGYNCN